MSIGVSRATGEGMWHFSTIGFFSIACARKADGSLDADAVMVRARRKAHLHSYFSGFSFLSESRV
jgi:hypothetical protein